MDKKITVYYDGLCRGCAFAADTLKGDQAVALVDANTGALPAGVTHREAMHDVHVVDDGGNVYKGADAVIKILERDARTRWLGRAARAPGMHGIAVALYRFISHYRYWLFGRNG